MQFLKEFLTYEDTIDKMKENYDSKLIYNFICNKDNVIRILKYFKSIGVNCIDKLLLYKLEIFFVNSDNLISAFDNYDISLLCTLLDEDINVINIVLN